MLSTLQRLNEREGRRDDSKKEKPLFNEIRSNTVESGILKRIIVSSSYAIALISSMTEECKRMAVCAICLKDAVPV